MEPRFPLHLEALVSSLRAQIARTRAGSKHPTIKGTSIEVILKRLLVQYLPTRYTVTSGQVASIGGHLSPQMDILVCDRTTFPPLVVNEDGSEVVCAESVYCAIEVKSAWSKPRVGENMRRFVRVDKDRRKADEGIADDRAAYFVVTAKGPDSPDLHDLEDKDRLVAVCSLAPGWFRRSLAGQTAFVPGKQNPLEALLHWMLRHCMESDFVELGSNEETFDIVRQYYGWPERGNH